MFGFWFGKSGVGPEIQQTRPWMILLPLVRGPPLSSTVLNSFAEPWRWEQADWMRVSRSPRWVEMVSKVKPFLCAFLSSHSVVPLISLISNYCLSPDFSSSCWKHTQVSILNKALHDLQLSPVSFSGIPERVQLCRNSPLPPDLCDLLIALTSLNLTFEPWTDPISGLVRSMLTAGFLSSPITFIF